MQELGRLIGKGVTATESLLKRKLSPATLEGPIIPEWAQVKDVRTQVYPSDLSGILKIISYPQVNRHLDPLPRIPDWSNKYDVDKAVDELAEYYNNYGEPNKITPFVFTNKMDRVIGVATLRWKGDPYSLKDQSRVSSVERVMFHPEAQGFGNGTRGVATVLDYAFYQYRGYAQRAKEAGGEKGVGAKEVRFWVMQDDISSPYGHLVEFWNRLGAGPVQGQQHRWSKFAEKRGMEAHGREAGWYTITRERYEEAKRNNPRIQAFDIMGLAA